MAYSNKKEYDIDALMKKKEEYIKKWNKITKELMLLPLENSLELDKASNPERYNKNVISYFLNKANSHIMAAKFALEANNTHSLAIQYRVLIELNEKHVNYSTNLLLAKTKSDRIQLIDYLILDFNKSQEAAKRLDTNAKQTIATERINPREFLLSQNDETINEEDFKHLGKQRIQYTPNLVPTFKKMDAFNKNYRESSPKNCDQEEKDSLKIATDIRGTYSFLSEKFIHPTFETLKERVISGGVYCSENLKEEKIFNLLMFNAAMKWVIPTADNLILLHKPKEKTQRDVARFKKKYKKELTLNSDILRILKSFYSILNEGHDIIRNIILTNEMFELEDERCLRLHKTFMHSLAFQDAAKKLNFSASCVEISVMIEMLGKINTSLASGFDLSFYKNHSHPSLGQQIFNIKHGGINYNSLDELALLTITSGYGPVIGLWIETFLTLSEAPAFDHKKHYLLTKVHYLLSQLGQHNDVIENALGEIISK